MVLNLGKIFVGILVLSRNKGLLSVKSNGVDCRGRWQETSWCKWKEYEPGHYACSMVLSGQTQAPLFPPLSPQYILKKGKHIHKVCVSLV